MHKVETSGFRWLRDVQTNHKFMPCPLELYILRNGPRERKKRDKDKLFTLTRCLMLISRTVFAKSSSCKRETTHEYKIHIHVHTFVYYLSNPQDVLSHCWKPWDETSYEFRVDSHPIRVYVYTFFFNLNAPRVPRRDL